MTGTGAEWLMICTCGDASVIMLVPNGDEPNQAIEMVTQHFSGDHPAGHTCRTGPVAGAAELVEQAPKINWRKSQ